MSEHIFTGGAIIIMLLLILYMVAGLFIEKKHLIFGHEASLVIIVGASISLAAFLCGFKEFNGIMAFDHNVFFYFCLPPIVFASGYNMKRKVFFENFTSVMIFGVFGTILQFTFFSLGTIYVNHLGWFRKYNAVTG